MNRITVYLNSLGRGARVLLISLAVIFVGAGVAQATASTIGANISTTGTLGVTGLSTLGQASSTMLSANTAYFGQTATSTFSANGSLSVGNSFSTVTITGSTTMASTTVTSAKVGQTGTQMSSLISGFCTITTAIPATNASSTQTYATCTPASSVTLSGTSARVLVQATSSLPFYVVVQAASSTAAGLIQVALTNFSTTTAVASATYALNFWAFE